MSKLKTILWTELIVSGLLLWTALAGNSGVASASEATGSYQMAGIFLMAISVFLFLASLALMITDVSKNRYRFLNLVTLLIPVVSIVSMIYWFAFAFSDIFA